MQDSTCANVISFKGGEQKRKRPDLETTPRKTEKKVSDQGSRSQDLAELFWQSRNITALEEKREPTCEPVVTRPSVRSARSLRCDRARAKLGRYVATELEPKLGRYIATERSSAWSLRNDRARAEARSLHSDRASVPLGRYVATELFRNIDTTISPCILVYPSMLSPEDRSEPVSCFPPF
ncbi:hypothetical protein F2Q68_00035171 [Brassica cretica]|uniref:Uncharacterized protein n=1 Tax=Brassica cretica TaxID=69181 RepID=A0A8S9H1W8_BRACR|nr:hypothetical protein F2Q68_00035171 [Brassica cretica]